MTVRMSNVSAVVSSLMAARPSRPRSNILNYGTTHNIYAMPRRTALKPTYSRHGTAHVPVQCAVP